MEAIFESFANCLSFENGITIEAARSLVGWMDTEGALDYDVLRQTYQEPADKTDTPPTLHLVA